MNPSNLHGNLNQLRADYNDDNSFLNALADWLGAIGSDFNIKGTDEDVYDAADCLYDAVGLPKESTI